MNIQDRFWAKVKTLEKGSCWEWQAYRNRLGYGVFGIKGRKTALAHRVSYEMHYGPIPEGMLVCHKCDNPACVNPDHLFLGTNKDNMDDCIKKGRKASAKAERNPRAVLNKEQVALIRKEYIPGEVRIVDLAQKYGVSKSQIWNIVSGQQWNEYPEVRA